MKLSIQEGSTNYAAKVVTITNVLPIDGKDLIQKTTVFGNNVIISKSAKIGDKCIYFCSGTKLSEDYCKCNNLYDQPILNLDQTKKGYISHKSRVKAIKLGGVISDGILMPLISLVAILGVGGGIDSLKEGDEFTHINDILICEKYFVPVRNSGQSKAPKQPKRISRLVENQFYLHNDTENLRRNIHKINPSDIIGIHYKKHGTSICIGNVLVKKNLKWYEKLLKKVGVNVEDTEYDIVYSSRKVVKNQYLNPDQKDGFYGEDIWGVVAKEIGHLIPKGWTIYGEILGYLPSGGAIQKKYDYGCKQGEHKFYVYKISVVNIDGKTIYLTDKQIEEWCEKVGLLYKDTFIYYGKASNYFDYAEGFGKEVELSDKDDLSYQNVEEWRNQFLNHLETLHNEKDCYMCTNKVPEEGIVLRIERLDSYEAYKLKSKRFILMESDNQEQEVSNIEDEQ